VARKRKNTGMELSVEGAGLDAADLRILRLLQNNADLSMQEIADKVGLSHKPCWRRYNRLKQKGVIEAKVAIVNAKKIGKNVSAICNVVLDRHTESALLAFEKAVLACPEIVECFAMTGAKSYTLRIATSTIEDFERFLKKKLLHLPGVATVDTNFAINTVKLTTALPI
jgi:Lrp/AsnC family transcriptional regulator